MNPSPSWPGLSRPSTSSTSLRTQDVDARDKPGHDEGGSAGRERMLTQDFTQRRPYNAVADFVDANVARGRAGKVAFTDASRTLTYGDLQRDTCSFARALGALGLRQESRVALLMLDTVDFPIAFW